MRLYVVQWFHLLSQSRSLPAVQPVWYLLLQLGQLRQLPHDARVTRLALRGMASRFTTSGKTGVTFRAF